MPRLGIASLVAGGLLLSAGGGFTAGRLTGDDLTWRTGTAVLTDHDGSPQFSVVSADKRITYAAGGSVHRWTDAAGFSHEGSWPDCLLPPTEQHPDRAQEVPIRFATIPLDESGFYSGPIVVSVDCRGQGG